MKVSLIALFSILFLSACTTPTLPKMKHHEPFMMEYEGIINEGIEGYFITHTMMQTMQEALINRRIDANICADVSVKQ